MSTKIRVECHKTDVVVKRKGKRPKPRKKYARGNVTYLSLKSWREMIFRLANCDAEFGSMLTLTIAGQDRDKTRSKTIAEYANDGVRLKRALNDLLRAKFKGEKYFWILEFQGNGSAHFHIWFEILPRNPTEIMNPFGEKSLVDIKQSRKISKSWTRLVCKHFDVPADHEQMSDMENVCARWEILRVKNGAAKYAAKESSKRVQKQPPEWFNNPGRFWSCSKSIKIPEPEMFWIDETAIDKYEFELKTKNGQVIGTTFFPHKVQFGKADFVRKNGTKQEPENQNESTVNCYH